MNKEEMFEFLGISKFHRSGYTGSRVKIMSDEKILREYLNVDKERWEKIIVPKGYQKENGSWHGSAVMKILLDVCPDAQFISFPFNGSFNGNIYKCECAEYIIDNKVNLFSSSQLGGTCNKAREKALQGCIDAGCTFFAAAGNKGKNGMLGEAKSEKYLAIGFVGEDLKYIGTSSIGKELDYVTIPGCYGDWTSYASPLFCGMCGLVQDFFIDKTGRALVRSELINFINDHLIDVEDEGFDVKTGNGLFILPNPAEIDISKYVPEYKAGEDKLLKQKFIDESKYSIKCPYEMDAEFIVVHNTANDAMAINEVNYMANNGEKVSFHIAVDDKEAIQAIPFNRNAFHAGDGLTGDGNRKGIAIEICYSRSGGERFEKAKANAIEVITDILIKRNWDISHVKKHFDFSGKYCPHRILDEGWDKFINQIQKRLEEKQMEEVNKPSDWAKEAWEWGIKNKICDGTNPRGTITREQVVQMLYNFLGKGNK